MCNACVSKIYQIVFKKKAMIRSIEGNESYSSCLSCSLNWFKTMMSKAQFNKPKSALEIYGIHS